MDKFDKLFVDMMIFNKYKTKKGKVDFLCEYVYEKRSFEELEDYCNEKGYQDIFPLVTLLNGTQDNVAKLMGRLNSKEDAIRIKNRKNLREGLSYYLSEYLEESDEAYENLDDMLHTINSFDLRLVLDEIESILLETHNNQVLEMYIEILFKTKKDMSYQDASWHTPRVVIEHRLEPLLDYVVSTENRCLTNAIIKHGMYFVDRKYLKKLIMIILERDDNIETEMSKKKYEKEVKKMFQAFYSFVIREPFTLNDKYLSRTGQTIFPLDVKRMIIDSIKESKNVEVAIIMFCEMYDKSMFDKNDKIELIEFIIDFGTDEEIQRFVNTDEYELFKMQNKNRRYVLNMTNRINKIGG